MKLKAVSGMMLTLLLTSMLTLAFNIQPVKAEQAAIIVPDDHEKIQWAIGNASVGDTIFVRAGTYYEHLTIDKSISLIGEDRYNTIIDGNYTGNVIEVTASNVNITGFTIQNSGSGTFDSGLYVVHSTGNNISYNTITNNSYGIHLQYYRKSVILGNDISSNFQYGIRMTYWSSNNVFSDNNIFSNYRGIAIGYDSSNNTVSGNTVSNNSMVGIRIEHRGENNTVFGNTFSNSYSGIHLVYSNNNVVFGNTVSNNSGGIGLSSSSDNIIFGNNFVDNTKQGYSLDSTNVWDDGYPSGGNYWSDYTGVDMKSGPNQDQPGSDGIGDTAYTIDANNQDNYPFMEPNLGWVVLYQHDLAVYLKAPAFLKPGESSLLEATVYNRGLKSETSVDLQLLINGTVVNTTKIPELLTMSLYTIDYLWTPTVEAIYNVTVYALPVSGENVTENNLMSKMIRVRMYPVHNLDTGIGYTTIQKAINATETLDGHTILVYVGTYYENLVVNKMVSLIGEKKYNTIIDGGGGNVIEVTASNVNITGFTIQKGGDHPNRGINVGEGSTGNNISYNIVTNSWAGIYLTESSNNIISGNNIRYNKHGIILNSSSNHNSISGNDMTANEYHGIMLKSYSNYNIISGNNIKESDWGGIYLTESSDNIIFGNNIKNNDYGFYFTYSSNNNIISGNNIKNNYKYGIYLHECSDNKFYHNNFIDNAQHVRIHVPGYTNFWDDGYPSGGNYWSDYTGVDEKSGPNQDQSGSDGIGDTPYVINENNQDNYPLIPEHDLVASITAPPFLQLGSSLSLNATVTNRGSSDETSVELVLLINGTTVDLTTIPFLQAGNSYTLSYLWTPTVEGTYNITAHVPPLPEETYKENNQAIKFVTVDGTPPTTTHDYDGLWHTEDFTITLTATDALSGVAETYYNINNGPTQTVSADGHPRITTESANNTLEYWSVDNAGNGEPHHVLTDIKLDKMQPPVASFTYSPTAPIVNEIVTFDASPSYDPDGTVVSYEWDFGDGATDSGEIVTHAYTDAGTYIVTLTVTDNEDATDTKTSTLIIHARARNVGVKAGDWIKYDYTVTGWPSGTPYPEWLKVEILSVEGTTATVRVTMHMSDGTEQSDTLSVDVVAGGGTFDTLFGFVISANCTTGDSIIMGGDGFTFNVTIDGETTRTYAGASRTVVHASFSQYGTELTYYWDKETGVMVEASTTSGGITGTAKATETNMWEPPATPLWMLWGFWVIIAVIFVAVVGAVYFLKKRKQPTTTPLPPEGTDTVSVTDE